MRAWLSRSTRQRHLSGNIRRQRLPGLASLRTHGFETLEDRTVLSADISGISVGQPQLFTGLPGQMISYTITVPNAAAASESTTDVYVTDALPASATVVNATPSSGTATVERSTNIVAADLGAIAPGANATLTITAIVNAAASVRLGDTASVWSPQDAVFNTGFNQKTSNTSSIAVDSLPFDAANVSVSQTGPATGAAFDTLTYTATLATQGTAEGPNATFIEQLDPNVMFFSASDTAGTKFTYDSTTGQVTGTVDIRSITSDTVKIVVVPNFLAANAGSVTNSAFVTIPTGNAGTPVGASTTTTVSRPAGPDNVALDIGEQTNSVTAGGVLDYDTVLINQVATPATNVAFSLQLDPNNQLVSISDTDHTAFTLLNGVVTGTVASIAGSAADHISIVVIPTAAAKTAGSVTDSELIAAPGGNLGPSTDSATTTVVAAGAAQANVTVTKSAPPSAVVGAPVTDTITLTNNGPAAATSVALVDMLGANVSNVSATDSAGDTFTFANGQLAGTIASLPVGATKVTVVYTPTATGDSDDTALIGVPGGNQGTGSATASTTVTTPADLSISKLGNPSTINVGGLVTYVVTIKNSGGATATGAVVTDVVPAGLTIVSAYPNGPGDNSPTNAAGDSVTISGNTVTDDLGPLGPQGEATQLTIIAAAAPLPGGTTNLTVSNTASVAFAGTTTTSDAVTTTISTTTPLLSITKVGTPSNLHVGGTVTYTITVTNSGGGAATGAVVTDSIGGADALTNLQAIDPTGTVTMTNNGSGEIIVTDHLGTVPANGTATLMITGRAAPQSNGNSGGINDVAQLTFAGTTIPSALVVTSISPIPAGVGFLAGVPGDGTPQTFVQNLYRELLGREPDTDGDAFWVAYLQQHNNAAGLSQAITAFMNSPEYAIHYVTTVYQVVLNRAPDAAGLQYWAGKMGTPGTPGANSGSADEKGIVAAFFGSGEFYLNSGNTPQGWINALYDDILGRAPDGSGMKFWANELATRGAGDRDGIVRDLLTTSEAAHFVLDSFYPAAGGTSGNPLPAAGSPASDGSTDLAILTGDGWENLYLRGPYDSQPEGNDAFFGMLAGGASWDDVQLQLLETGQYYSNPNRPVTGSI